MILVRATIEGDRVVIDGLSGCAKSAPDALKRGLRSAARGIYGESYKNLDGPGRTPVRTHGRSTWRATGYQREGRTRLRSGKIKNGVLTGMHSFLGARPGSYPPVPSITGNLKGRLAILEPGESKKGDGDIGSFHAGESEFVIYDSASYAYVIRGGKKAKEKGGRGSSKTEQPPRDFLGDGLKTYDQTVGITTPVEEELGKEIDKA